jgi:hypothetical protein
MKKEQIIIEAMHAHRHAQVLQAAYERTAQFNLTDYIAPGREVHIIRTLLKGEFKHSVRFIEHYTTLGGPIIQRLDLTQPPYNTTI